MSSFLTPKLRCLSYGVTLLAVWLAISTTNPVQAGGLDNLGKVLKAPFEFVGGVAGAAVGGFVNSAATPTIQSAEASGHALLSDLDGRMGKRLDEFNTLAKEKIIQLDLSLEARIKQFDKATETRIEQVDKTLDKRIAQVNLVLSDSIQKVDVLLSERIAQADDIAERRIGNLDVVLTRAGLTFEEATSHTIKMVGVMVFLGLVIWRSYWISTRFKGFSPPFASRIAVEVCAAALVLCAVLLLGNYMTGLTRRRAELLTSDYRQAYQKSLDVLDFRRAHFLASQIQALNPLSMEDRGMLLKARLLRDVFSRPTLLQTNGGMSELVRSVQEAATILRGQGNSDDPDLLVVGAYMLWQNGRSRNDEYLAACLCMAALKTGEFPLRLLASNYIQMYAHNPLPNLPNYSGSMTKDFIFYNNEELVARASLLHEEDVATDAVSLEIRQRREQRFLPLMHVIVYDRLVRTLDREASNAYVNMVKSQVEYQIIYDKLTPQEKGKIPILRLSHNKAGQTVILGDPESNVSTEELTTDDKKIHDENLAINKSLSPVQAELLKPAKHRLQAAILVKEAWDSFDKALKQAEVFLGTSSRLAAFTLNDAILSRAMWFIENPTATAPAVSLFELDRDKPLISGLVREKMLPLRIGWRNAFVSDLSGIAMDFVDSEEYNRYKNYEERTIAFEKALLGYYRIKRDSKSENRNLLTFDKCIDVAKVAAELGIYTTLDSGSGLVSSSFSYAILSELTSDEVTQDVFEREYPRLTEAKQKISMLIQRRPFRSL